MTFTVRVLRSDVISTYSGLDKSESPVAIERLLTTRDASQR